MSSQQIRQKQVLTSNGFVFIVLLVLFLLSDTIIAQDVKIEVISDQKGTHLQVAGKDFMIKGMNWDYYPVGTNYTYNLWQQPDEIIREALENEMTLLKNMGVNTIRVYAGIPARWVQYIYQNYHIYTMLNHPFGRYGLSVNGSWMQKTDYADSSVRKQLLTDIKILATEFNDTPGLLMYLLGNENNYGLFWGGAESEDIPVEDRKSTHRAYDMYKLFNNAVQSIKKIDTSHPVAICNGDLLFIEIIAQECKDIDIFGTNMYRGLSFGDAFQRVKDLLGKPILFTEFGSDAYNALEKKEDQQAQARYLLNNWKEIYQNAAGLGKTENAIGGFTFQFSDGWWKHGQTFNLDVHDTTASWSNGGFQFDFAQGTKNMNEEWFGICAKGLPNDRGLYPLYPRAAYYVLQKVHKLDPFAETMNAEKINKYFESISVTEAFLKAQTDH